MQIKQEQRQESDATVKKVEDDRPLATQVKFHSPHKNAHVFFFDLFQTLLIKDLFCMRFSSLIVYTCGEVQT